MQVNLKNNMLYEVETYFDKNHIASQVNIDSYVNFQEVIRLMHNYSVYRLMQRELQLKEDKEIDKYSADVYFDRDIKKHYDKWQCEEKDLKHIQPVRFTEEEMLNFGQYLLDNIDRV